MSSIEEKFASIESCCFVVVTEAEGAPMEKEFISNLNSLSNAVGKKFVLIMTEDSIKSKLIADKKGKKKTDSRGTIGTKGGSVLLSIPDQGFHELVVRMIQETVIEYLFQMNEPRNSSIEPVNSSNKANKKNKTTSEKDLKIQLNNLLDDRPPMSPTLFVVLVGFTDPKLILEFNTQNLPLKSIIKVQQSDSNVNSSRLPFWEIIESHARLQSANFFVRPLHIPSAISADINDTYDILCCVLYDIVETLQEYAKYKDNCHVYPLDFLNVESKQIYDNLINDIPLECVNVEYILHCIIEQVIYFDENLYSTLEEAESVSDVSNLHLSWATGNMLDNFKGMDAVSLDEDNNPFKTEKRLPFITQKINESNSYLSRTFYYRDKYARNAFHLEQFPKLYLTLSQIIKPCIQHLETIPADLSKIDKSYFIFHLNRLLKHVESYLPCITQRQIKYYLELLICLKRCMRKDLVQPYYEIDNESNNSIEYVLSDDCTRILHKKYENSFISEESYPNEKDDSLNSDILNYGTDCVEDALWDSYIGQKRKKLAELKKLLHLYEFQGLMDFVNASKLNNDSSLVNIQVEHFDTHVLAQVLHEERFLHQKHELAYFAPTDTSVVMFYSPTVHFENWSNAGRIPLLMNLQLFSNMKIFNKYISGIKEDTDANHFSSKHVLQDDNSVIKKKIYRDKGKEIPNFAYDIVEDSAEILTDSEFMYNEHGLNIKIQKINLKNVDSLSVDVQFGNVFLNIYGRIIPRQSEAQFFYFSEVETSSSKLIRNLYSVDSSVRLVLSDIIMTISKHAFHVPYQKNLDSSYGLKSHSDTLQYALNFSVTLPNGLLLQSVQLQDETVIRQLFIQDLEKESFRYYFRNGKVLFSCGNERFHVYHGNGNETYCEEIKIYKGHVNVGEQTSPQTKIPPSLQKSTYRAYKESDEKSTNVSPKTSYEKCHVDINILKYLDPLGNFKCYVNNDLTEEYLKYFYKHACSFSSDELYLSREDGLELYYTATDDVNTMITKFANALTITSECYIRDEEEYISDREEDILSELDPIEEDDRTRSEKSFEPTFMTHSIDGFYIIDQNWKIEEEHFVPIVFTSDGLCDINLPDLKIHYRYDQLQIIADNVLINVDVDSIAFKSFLKDGQENKVLLNWNNKSEHIIQASHNEGLSFYFKSDGTTNLNSSEKSDEVVTLNNCKCYVVNRDGSGYGFVDSSEVTKHENIEKKFEKAQYNLPNCKEFVQTNIQRNVEPICDKFLFKPAPINPKAIKRRDLRICKEISNGWLFYPNANVESCDPPVKLNEPFVPSHHSIELRKFEQIMPSNVDILEILNSALRDYFEEGSSLCDQFEIEPNISP